MIWTNADKHKIKQEIIDGLKNEPEVRKIIIFGSFVDALEPKDLDVAVFQDSEEAYLPLALKYRRQTRTVSQKIPVDIVPIRSEIRDDPFLQEIESGEVIYEG